MNLPHNISNPSPSLYFPRALRLRLSGGAFSVSVMETQLRDHERIPLYAIDHSMLIIYST